MSACQPGASRLVLEPLRTTLSVGHAPDVSLPIGVRALAAMLRHDPPTGGEIEQAIDAIEDALAASRLPHGERGELTVGDPWLRALPGLQGSGSRLTRDEVEAVFQRVASAALGTPVARSDLPAGSEAVAALLILRECLHHLGYDGVRIAAA